MTLASSVLWLDLLQSSDFVFMRRPKTRNSAFGSETFSSEPHLFLCSLTFVTTGARKAHSVYPKRETIFYSSFVLENHIYAAIILLTFVLGRAYHSQQTRNRHILVLISNLYQNNIYVNSVLHLQQNPMYNISLIHLIILSHISRVSISILFVLLSYMLYHAAYNTK